MNKVIFTCKNCGWDGQLVSNWADIKPVFCPNKKCQFSKEKSKGRKSFRSNPEMLEITFPREEQKKEVKKDISANKSPKLKPKKLELPKKPTTEEESEDGQRKIKPETDSK